MPVVEFTLDSLNRLLGKDLSPRELEELVPFAKAELDGVEDGLVKLDLKDTNRPDLLSVEGIARELRGHLGIEKGLPNYTVRTSRVSVTVDEGLCNIRPAAAYAIVKGVHMSEELLEQLIQLQEKICGTFGRKRREVAIGLFDYDKVHGNVRYYAAPPSERFVPLGFNTEMSLKEILKKHPKGVEYGHLLKGHKRYPLLVDSEHNVLSMPPIINSEYSGKVLPSTRNLFVDVTGFKQELVEAALEIMCMALADHGGTIYSVKVRHPGNIITTPSFKPVKQFVSFKLIEGMLGYVPSRHELIKLLAKKHMECRVKEKGLEVLAPSYRIDILHPVDIVEDLIIEMDYNAIGPQPIEVATVGSELKESMVLEDVKELCIGLGLQELLSFHLTSKEKQATNMGVKPENFVELANPVSSEYAVFRKSILPELLDFFARNKTVAFPQRVFEIGRVLELDSSRPYGYVSRYMLCVAISDAKVDFNEIKRYLDAFALNSGISYKLKKHDFPWLEKGIGAEIFVGSKSIGFIGEVSKQVRENFGLTAKVAAFELELFEEPNYFD